MTGDPRHELGRRAEKVAAKTLRRQGYRIVDRNWRCRLGEIDLVARHGEDMVIIEVKARDTEEFGGPEAAVAPDKQRKLSRLLDYYRVATRAPDVNWRFDVVAVVVDDDRRIERCTVYQDAFEYVG